MILFVFEGKKREPDIFKTLEYLFFPKGQSIVCSFGNNIYELYRQMEELGPDGDIVSLLREKNKSNPETPFGENVNSSDFSEVYLFFDYDFQNKNLTLAEMNQQISEMLERFDDETDNGKLYINYPMIEAIRYTKTLPDEHFQDYSVSRAECHDRGFKDMVQQFSAYGSLDFIVLDLRKAPSQKRVSAILQNWHFLEKQNVVKANILCNGEYVIPTNKESISQKKIFDAQFSKFIIPKDEVSILSAFPLFKFEYFKPAAQPPCHSR